MTVIELDGNMPDIAPGAWIAPGATVVGQVSIGSRASIWYSAVVRGDRDRISIGDDTNIQDCCALHTDLGFVLSIGRGVSVGHGAVLHGCVIGDNVLIGMGAIVMNGARIGENSIVAAGSIVLEGTEIAPGSLVRGVPGRAHRETTEAEHAAIASNAQTYLDLAAAHAAAR